MDSATVGKVLGLIVNNPELLIAAGWLFGFFFAALGLVAWLTWFLCKSHFKGKIAALEVHLSYYRTQLDDTQRRMDQSTRDIELATAEQAKIQQQIATIGAPESLVATVANSFKFLQNATMSATAAQTSLNSI